MEHAQFGGVIGESWRESTPWWPPQPEPPEGAPNVVLVVLDDVGYAQLGCYGSDIDTPTLDRLAHGGIRLANFHTTALCSPTRACLLTGRNHHSVGMGRIADLAIGFPGHSGNIGPEHGFMSEILNTVGYASYAVGKWHLTPDDETNMAAPRRTWPVARGFQRWYGFHGGETHQFVPALFQDNQWVPPPARPEDGYHLSEDIADKAILYLSDLRAVEPDTPFFLYFATGAAHSPHHAPREWIERYTGRFDEGWDVWRERTFARQNEMGLLPPGTELSPRPPWVPAWDELTPDEQRIAARFMECFAAFLSHADAQIGRVIDFIDSLGELDDTLIIAVSDNGASAEGGRLGSINDARTWNGIPAGHKELAERIDELGGPTAHNNYPWGWTMAGNTPLRRWKREVHEGGVTDPCIFHWPNGLPFAGELRRQYAHAIDVLPTVLDLVGVTPPERINGVEQTPIEGVSLMPVLRDPSAPEVRITQYYEMLGSRAIYHDGWKAVTFKPLARLYDDGLDPDAPFSEDKWELYHVAEDFSEVHDLADQEPERLARMVDLWWQEARAHSALPLDNRPLAALLHPRPKRAGDRDRYEYFPHASPVPESVAVNVRNRSHVVTLDVDVPADAVFEGVLLAQGSVLGGWTFFAKEGCLHYEHNVAGRERHRVESSTVVPPGRRRLSFEFEKTAEFAGIGRLRVDDAIVGEDEIPFVTPARLSITGAGLTCGYEMGPAISTAYEAPFRCTARILRAFVDVSGQPYVDLQAELEALLTAQ